jgi:hypothetical protein
MVDEQASRNGQRANSHHPGDHNQNGQPREIDRTVPRDAWAADGFAPLPGDGVSLPGGERALVETVYLCAEPDGDDLVRWSWIVLADGRLLEIAPRGCALYEPPRLLVRGSGPFLELVAQDGALVRFEERVRAGTWEARPVRLSLDGRRWRVTSTGTAMAQRLGSVPTSGWGQLGGVRPPVPVRAGETVEQPDVYFTLAGLSDADALGLGLWATDICLAFGRRLGDAPSAAGLAVVAEGEQRG